MALYAFMILGFFPVRTLCAQQKTRRACARRELPTGGVFVVTYADVSLDVSLGRLWLRLWFTDVLRFGGKGFLVTFAGNMHFHLFILTTRLPARV